MAPARRKRSRSKACLRAEVQFVRSRSHRAEVRQIEQMMAECKRERSARPDSTIDVTASTGWTGSNHWRAPVVPSATITSLLQTVQPTAKIHSRPAMPPRHVVSGQHGRPRR